VRAKSLEDLEPQFRAIADRASTLVAGLADVAALTRRPKPDSWSVAECLAHLNISADFYFPLWHRELAQARRDGRAADPPYRLDFWGWALVWTLEPPPKFRLRAPSKSQPVEIGSPESVLPGFLDRHRRIIETLHSARGLAVDKIKLVSPFDSRVSYSIWSSFCLTASHERRHLLQAERVARVQAQGAARDVS